MESKYWLEADLGINAERWFSLVGWFGDILSSTRSLAAKRLTVTKIKFAVVTTLFFRVALKKENSIF